MSAHMAVLALQPRQDDGDTKNQYNSGYWCKARHAKHVDHAAERG